MKTSKLPAEQLRSARQIAKEENHAVFLIPYEQDGKTQWCIADMISSGLRNEAIIVKPDGSIVRPKLPH